MSYSMVELGDVCEVIAGQSPPGHTYNREGEGLPFFQGKTDFGEFIPVPRMWCTKPNKVALPGDLLISIRAPVGPTNLCDAEACIGRGIASIRPSAKVDVRYLMHWMRSIEPRVAALGRGSTFEAISKSDLIKIKIPLPPLPTQRRIAAVLDKAQALVANDRQTLALYDQLSKSLFLEMFGDPVRNERGWEVVKLGDVITDVVGGESVGGDERPLEKGEWAVLKISAVTRGVFDATEYKVADLAQLKRAPVIPKRGDLLFSRANTREMVGATCVVDQDCTNLFLPDKLWRLDMDPAATNAWYLHHLLHHAAFRASTLGSLATGTSGSMLNISKAKLLGMGIPLPPYKDQQRFADGIEAMNTQRAQAEQSLRQSEGLFRSLLQSAFSGELQTSKPLLNHGKEASHIVTGS